MDNPLRASHGRLVRLLLIIIPLVTFWQVRDFDFVNLDDGPYVRDNPHIRDGLTWHGMQWALKAGLLLRSPHADYWQPVTFLSRMLDIQCFGFDASMHHLVNLAFHVLNTLLLFEVLRRMTGAQERSAWVAAFFAVHPLHVEAVAWVTERKDMLSGFFWMLTLGAYHHYTLRPSAGRYAGVMAWFALGLMSKPMGMTLPFVLLLLDLWPLQRLEIQNSRSSVARRAARLLAEKLPLIALACLSGWITLRMQADHLRQASAGEALRNVATGYGTYLWKTIFPHPLAVYYPRWGNETSWLAAGGSLLALAGISLWVTREIGRRPFGFVGWWWFIGTLAPVIGLNDIAGADRFTYLPLIGLFILAAWGLPEFQIGGSGRWRASLRVAAGTALAVFMIVSMRQLRHWQNGVTLFEHAVAATHNNALAYNNLGTALWEAGRLDEALEQFQQTLRLKPLAPEAHVNLGAGLAEKGRVEEAVRHFRQALQINPSSPSAHNNLGATLAGQGKVEEALKAFQQALRIKPDFADAHCNLGRLLAQKGEIDRAMEHYRQALAINPDHVGAHVNLGITLVQKGGINEAISHYARALELNPADPEAHNDLGNALLRLGQVQAAIPHYQEALRGRSDYAEAHYNLGNALALTGKSGEALAHYRRAVEIKPTYAEAHYNLGICLAQKGEREEARRHLQETVRLRPDFEAARRALADLQRERPDKPRRSPD